MHNSSKINAPLKLNLDPQQTSKQHTEQLGLPRPTSEGMLNGIAGQVF